jgi:hypothetical protein
VNTGVGILAPIPAVILKSAFDTCAKAGRVAFGTNAWELFEKIEHEYGSGLPVLIYPTHFFGDPDRLCTPAFASFRGIFVGTRTPLGGKHPNPALRPAITVEGDETVTGGLYFERLLIWCGWQKRIELR